MEVVISAHYSDKEGTTVVLASEHNGVITKRTVNLARNVVYQFPKGQKIEDLATWTGPKETFDPGWTLVGKR